MYACSSSVWLVDFQVGHPWIYRGGGHGFWGCFSAGRPSTVDAGEMTGKAMNSRLARPLPAQLGGVDQMPELEAARQTVDRTRADLARILINLTTDVEKFDSLIAVQRKLLEQGGVDGPAFGIDKLDAQWERLSFEAAEMVGCARQALERLRQMWEVTAPAPKRAPRGGAGALAKDGQAGSPRLRIRPSSET
jgi:hypothetical protein